MRLRGWGSFVYVAGMNRAAINKEESRAETLAAFIASLAIHLFLVLAVAYFLLSSRVEPQPQPFEEEPLQITILQPSVPVPVKVKPKYISAVPQAPAPPKPKTDAAFESDKDSVAASEAAPSGREAAPSLDGKEDKNIELQNQQYTEGKKEEPAAPPQPQADKQAQKREETAEPAPTPRADPELALIEKPRPKPVAEVVKKTTPAQKATAPSASGFQPETRVTRLRGSISNRGRASVEANATPLGRYKKAVSDAIGSRWYYYVKSQMGLMNIGTVDIRFTILPNGKVKAPQILNNSSNESFASVSLSAIVQAEIPPIPPEVEAVLENGRIEIDYSFSILGN
jgi:outer membrane biosynthesis protein TonB